MKNSPHSQSSVSMGLIGFISNLGGLFGNCLNYVLGLALISCISLIELLYWASIGLAKNLVWQEFNFLHRTNNFTHKQNLILTEHLLIWWVNVHFLVCLISGVPGREYVCTWGKQVLKDTNIENFWFHCYYIGVGVDMLSVIFTEMSYPPALKKAELI